MTDYAIDHGVRPPAKRLGSAPKYPFAELVPDGDPFFVTVERTDEKGKRRIRSAAADHARRHGVKLMVRVAQRNGVWGMRVWRIA